MGCGIILQRIERLISPDCCIRRLIWLQHHQNRPNRLKNRLVEYERTRQNCRIGLVEVIDVSCCRSWTIKCPQNGWPLYRPCIWFGTQSFCFSTCGKELKLMCCRASHFAIPYIRYWELAGKDKSVKAGFIDYCHSTWRFKSVRVRLKQKYRFDSFVYHLHLHGGKYPDYSSTTWSVRSFGVCQSYFIPWWSFFKCPGVLFWDSIS